MKYSIVIPVYNVEQYLGECIESALNQPVKDVEVILVNDGSTDSSGAICRDYAHEYPGRVNLIEQQNSGLLLARRAGFRAASGDVLMTLDSDDKLRADALAVIDRAFSSSGADLVIFALSRREDFSTDGIEPPFSASTYFSGDGLEELKYRLCSSSALNPLVLKAARRTIFNVDEDYKKYAGLSYGEDLLQSLPLVDSASTACYIHEPLYYYRVNYSSLTKRFSEEQVRSRRAVRSEQMRYAERWAERYENPTFVTGVKGLCITSYAELAQLVAETLPASENNTKIAELAASEEFKEAYRDTAARKRVRFDYRIIAALMIRGIYSCIPPLCRVKGFLRKTAGR